MRFHLNFNSFQFALFIYTQYLYSVNMGSNRDYNSIGDNLVLNTYAEDIYIYSGRTVGR